MRVPAVRCETALYLGVEGTHTHTHSRARTLGSKLHKLPSTRLETARSIWSFDLQKNTPSAGLLPFEEARTRVERLFTTVDVRHRRFSQGWWQPGDEGGRVVGYVNQSEGDGATARCAFLFSAGKGYPPVRKASLLPSNSR